MSVYLIADSEIHDPEAYEKYKESAPKYVARHGGEYCCRGGTKRKLVFRQFLLTEMDGAVIGQD